MYCLTWRISKLPRSWVWQYLVNLTGLEGPVNATVCKTEPIFKDLAKWQFCPGLDVLTETNIKYYSTLQWRHNESGGVSNHQRHDCLVNRLFKHRLKKTSKSRVTGLCEGNSPVTGAFPAQRASDRNTTILVLKVKEFTNPLRPRQYGRHFWDNVSNVFSRKKILAFCFKFLRVQLTISQHWFR